MDAFMGSTIIGFAAWEREQIRMRTNSGKRQHAKTGKWPFSSVPYGYKKNKDKELEIYEDEAKIIQSIFAKYLYEKKTMFEIFEELNAEGIPPPTLSSKNDPKQSGNRTLRKNAVPYWCFSSVRKVIASAVVYSGTYQAFKTQYKKIGDRTVKLGERPKDEWIEIKIPAIITVAEAEEVLGRSELNRNYTKNRNNRTYLLQGKLFCNCELDHHNFVGYYNKRKDLRNYRCSLCNPTKTDPTRRCSNNISGYKIDTLVIDTLKEVFLDPMKFMVDYGLSAKAESSDGGRYAELMYEIQEIDKKLGRAEELYIEGGITKDRLYELKRNIEDKRITIATELDRETKYLRQEAFEVDAQDTWLQSAKKLYEFACDFFETASYEELKEVVNLVIYRVIVPTDRSKPVRILFKMPVGEFEWKYLSDDGRDFKEFNLDATKNPLAKRKVEFLDPLRGELSSEHMFLAYLNGKP